MSGKQIDEAVRLLREYRKAPKFSNDHDAIKRTVALEDEIDAFLAAAPATSAPVGVKTLSEFMAEQEALHPGIHDKVQAAADELRASLAQQQGDMKADILRTAAEYHYAQAACPRDQFGNTSNHRNPRLEAWHRQIADAITAIITPPSAKEKKT